MTSSNHHNEMDALHQQITALLPWYCNGTLSADDKDAVEQHLNECPRCQEELLYCQKLAQQRPSPVGSWTPSAAHFAGIMAEVDKLENADKSHASGRSKTSAGIFGRFAAWFSPTPRPVRWALAFETLTVAALAMFVLHLQSVKPPTSGDFETLSNSETTTTTPAAGIHLVFAKDITAGDMQALLKQAKAQIRQGPSALGSYTVEVPKEEKDRALKLLRSHSKIKLAEPAE